MVNTRKYKAPHELETNAINQLEGFMFSCTLVHCSRFNKLWCFISQ